MTDGYYRLPPNLAEDIDEYEQDVQRFLAGKLPAGVLKAKRVPRGVYEQRQDGTYMVRVRVAGGTLTARQAGKLAGLAEEYGNGLLHVTTRQDVQLHDISIENTPGIMRRLLEVGLTSKGGGGNTVRNVAACPFAGICPHECFDVTPFAHAVTEYLIPLVGSYNLPRKYKIAFSGCSADCALAQVADLGFVAEVRDGEPGFRVFAGGGMGAHSRVADLFLEWIPATQVIRVAEALRRLFDRFGDRANKHKARLRFVFEKMGVETLRREFDGLFASVERDVPAAEACAPINGSSDAGRAGPPRLNGSDGARFFCQRQSGFVAVPLHLPLGFISAGDFARISEIAQKFSEEKGLRTTRFQNLLIRFVPADAVASFYCAIEKLETDVLSSTPLERFVVCAGASTCRLGLCLSRNAAMACAVALREAHIDSATMEALEIYVNGCPNGCGHQPIGQIGLFGAAQRADGRLAPSYRITLGGRCCRVGAKLGLPSGQIPARALPLFLKELALDFQEHRTSDEGFIDYFDRMGTAHFDHLVEHHAGVPTYEEQPEFYRDFGVEEDFSLAGRGAGECGAGVFEIILEDLAAAEKAEEPFDTLLPTARALLITRGVDARDPDIVFREFEKHFVNTGLVTEDFRALLTRARSFTQGWQQAFEGYEDAVERLLNRVKLLYSTLDANLEFHPPEATVSTTAEGEDTVPGRASPQGGISEELDLRGVACPMNFVKAKLRLEGMDVGKALAIVLDDGEPVQNVPASFRNEGQAIEETTDLGDGHWRVVVRKRQ